MRKGGKILALIMEKLEEKIKPGVSTKQIDELAIALCKQNNVEPAFLGYEGYQAATCIGIDDVAIHGIPSETELLEDGQTVSVDFGIKYLGYYLDHAQTYAVGKVDRDGVKLIESTRLALKAAIKQVKPGNTVGDIGFAIEQVATMSSFSVITAMTGHGVGKDLHEDPAIPCFGDRGKGQKLRAGMTIAVEAMINEGGPDLILENDGWTTVTADGKRSTIFEHTVLVTAKGGEILTIK